MDDPPNAHAVPTATKVSPVGTFRFTAQLLDFQGAMLVTVSSMKGIELYIFAVFSSGVAPETHSESRGPETHERN